jgi:RHS repeat-associated protein
VSTDQQLPNRIECRKVVQTPSASSGVWGNLAWTYDANGNRLTDTWNGFLTNYTIAANSNRLTQTVAGGQTRAFTHDAAGNVITDSRTGTAGMSFEWDQEGRLLKSYKTTDPADASNFLYDARWRLASRTVTSAANPTGTFTGFIHDLSDRIIAETDSSGNTRREYIWAGDIPIAVVGNVATSPTLWMVHTDHLLRPARMTDATGALVWDVIFRPFGEVNNISENPATNAQRFPGQWFQLQNGLAYNWHRHYDASLGRYVSSDPLGLTAMLSDGPSTYGYAGQRPGVKIDPTGLRAAMLYTPIPRNSNIQTCADDGTPKNNTRQNKQVDDVCRTLKLTKEQRQELHKEIHGLNLGYLEILDLAKDLFCK